MYDELIKRLWECASGECFNCSQYTETTNASVCQKELMKQAADAIEELTGFVQEAERDRDEYIERLDKANDAIEERNKPKWIPVTERLPDDDTHVLGWDGKRVRFVYVITDLVFDAFAEKEGITHWMPLPQPPKEE